MVPKQFKKDWAYLHLSDEKHMPEPTDDNYDILYKARPGVDYDKEIPGVFFFQRVIWQWTRQ
jgi:hypothetical protein